MNVGPALPNPFVLSLSKHERWPCTFGPFDKLRANGVIYWGFAFNVVDGPQNVQKTWLLFDQMRGLKVQNS
jgi:hypothetical protein